VLLHRGEADRIQPAELANGALTVEGLRDDVAPRGIAEREKQPIGLFPALQSSYNHMVVGLHLPSTMSMGPLRVFAGEVVPQACRKGPCLRRMPEAPEMRYDGWQGFDHDVPIKD
jgi:hypothetical protein